MNLPNAFAKLYKQAIIPIFQHWEFHRSFMCHIKNLGQASCADVHLPDTYIKYLYRTGSPHLTIIIEQGIMHKSLQALSGSPYNHTQLYDIFLHWSLNKPLYLMGVFFFLEAGIKCWKPAKKMTENCSHVTVGYCE